MPRDINKYNFAEKLSRYFRKIECSDWYISYMQEVLLHAIEKEEPNIRGILNENRALKNIYCGKRCFVLGNGPSLNNIDFKKLSQEIVFTVNQLPEHPRFQELQSNYHVVTDLQAFGLRYGKERLTPGFARQSLQMMRSLAQNGNSTLIVPYRVKKILKREGITDRMPIKYICYYEAFMDGYHSCDLTKPIAAFSGVIPTAILCAVYMGFAEIYLLGCEQTAVIDMLECALGNRTKYGHAYGDQEKIDDDGYRILVGSYGIKKMLLGECTRHEGFGQIYSFCRNRKVNVYNLTDPTLIDSIPRCRFEDVIK